MILLNFSHPVTDEQAEQIKRAVDLDAAKESLEIATFSCHMEVGEPFNNQIDRITRDVSSVVGLMPEHWQTEPLLVILPALSTAAALLLAELHGRCGYYPPVVRLKQEDGVIPPRYVLAEILDLNGQRQNARKRR